MRKRLFPALLLAAAVASGQAQSRAAAPQTLDSILHAVDAHYNHLSTLKASYTEHYTGLGMNRTETGTLLLRKPGRMRWIYSAPVGKVFVLDGKYAWSYTPGDAEVQRIPAKQLDDLRSPLRFLLGHTELKRELDGISVAPQGANFVIRGVPKGMAERVRQLTLVVSATGLIQLLRLEEIDGSATEFTFADMEENAPIPATEFTFTPPAGVAVVNGLAPV